MVLCARPPCGSTGPSPFGPLGPAFCGVRVNCGSTPAPVFRGVNVCAGVAGWGTAASAPDRFADNDLAVRVDHACS